MLFIFNSFKIALTASQNCCISHIIFRHNSQNSQPLTFVILMSDNFIVNINEPNPNMSQYHQSQNYAFLEFWEL